MANSREINPLREGLDRARVPEPCVMVIFGATGDLTRRKLMPALYNLHRERLLPEGFSAVGFARREKSHDDFRREMMEAVGKYSRGKPVQPALWGSFARGLYYFQANFEDFQRYLRLAEMLKRLDEERGTRGNRIFYLATPPSHYTEIVERLGDAGLAERGGWSRIIVEKPFGRDLTTAQELNRQLGEIFREDQVYRIDHYLGKETVQNILVFRFANGIFEPLWNRHYVDHVQIAVSEDLGVEGRGRYFEEAGITRDIVQNHILQLLCLVAMEPPVAPDADAIRDEKLKVLRSIRPIAPGEVGEYTVRGQYGRGYIAGESVPGYREEEGVSSDSITETFVALKLFVDNWRWAGVPFYLRAGKRMPKRATEIAIHFRRAPHLLFDRVGVHWSDPNVLIIRIQPDEGIALKFGSKVPGPKIQIQSVMMDFRYGASFGIEPPEAYERLLLDCMMGDPTLFARRDEIEAAWEFVTRIIEGWQSAPPPAFPNYEAGTWGPAGAASLIERDGRSWRRL
ncbi:MAG: glucose-6-phosphate dehydrogenase [bacterium]